VLFSASRFDIPKIGDMVLVVGGVSYWTKGGKVSFNAKSIAPYGKGLLYEKFLELKNKLEQLGYFAPERKKIVPKRPKRIGIVTSETGAVIQDIKDVSFRRNPGINLILYPVKVQGIGAEFEIAKGIDFFSNYDVDVIIVARGGGSLEDLQPFNTEVVADAVYRCQKPLVSAVGHETDTTIIDFVADLRVPTPSAAAELVVNRLADDIIFVTNFINRIERALHLREEKYRNKINNSVNLGFIALNKKLLISNNAVISNHAKLNNSVNVLLLNTYNKINLLSQGIAKLNPIAILDKGYAIVEVADKPVMGVHSVKVGDSANIKLKDGILQASVNSISKKEEVI